MERIQSALRSLRVPAAPGEYDLHAQIARALENAGLEYVHEARLCPGRRADFLVGDIVIEVKKGRPERARLLAQARKYLACPQIAGLVVVSQRNVILPGMLMGKPILLLTLNKLWGVSLP